MWAHECVHAFQIALFLGDSYYSYKMYNQRFVHYGGLLLRTKKDIKTTSHPCLFFFLINIAKCINGAFLAASNETLS